MIRKFLAFVLILMLSVASCAYADVDLSRYGDAELQELIRQARAELAKRNPLVEKETILYEDVYVKVTYTSMEIDRYGELKINCIVENKSESNIRIKMTTATCNGWDIVYYANEGIVTAPALSKSRDAFEFAKCTELSEVKSVAEIEEIRFTVEVRDSDTYDTLSESKEFFYIYMPVQ